MNRRAHQLADLILEIEAELRKADLWERGAPPAEALASTAPFCYDTLEFTQGLQWVMLPRLVQMVEQEQPWPNKSEIAPLAEESFKKLDHDTDSLLKLMHEFDELINER